MVPFLAFGTVWWILITIAFAIWLLFAATRETPIMATIAFIMYLLIVQFFSGVPIFQEIGKRPWIFIGLVGFYLLCGVIWSFVKWWMYIKKRAEGLAEDYLRDRNRDDEIERRRAERSGEPVRTVTDRFKEYARERLPTARSSGGLISLWIMYWPFSLIVAIFEDLVRTIVKQIVTTLRKVYEWIREKAMVV